MTRAFLCGLAALLAFDTLWIVSVDLGRYPAIVLLFLYGGPFLASAMTAYLAPRRRILLGTWVTLPAAFLMIALPAIYGAIGGHVDSVGTLGNVILFLWYLFYTFPICAFGSAFGTWMANRRDKRSGLRSREISPARTP